MLKFHNIFTLISQQIIGSKLLIMDKRNDISRGFNLKPVTTCHLEFVMKIL